MTTKKPTVVWLSRDTETPQARMIRIPAIPGCQGMEDKYVLEVCRQDGLGHPSWQEIIADNTGNATQVIKLLIRAVRDMARELDPED